MRFLADENMPGVAMERVIEALHAGSDWAGHFAVIESDRVRIRQLPG